MADPDYVYDPDAWEATYAWSERDLLVEDGLDHGEVKRIKTLIDGPDKFVARVVTKRDDDGSAEEWEIRWFDTEAEAKAAVQS